MKIPKIFSLPTILWPFSRVRPIGDLSHSTKKSRVQARNPVHVGSIVDFADLQGYHPRVPVCAAALGRCASKLPPEFVKEHPEIDWLALEDFRTTAFHDGIDVLILRDRLQEKLPLLREGLQKILEVAEEEA